MVVGYVGGSSLVEKVGLTTRVRGGDRLRGGIRGSPLMKVPCSW